VCSKNSLKGNLILTQARAEFLSLLSLINLNCEFFCSFSFFARPYTSGECALIRLLIDQFRRCCAKSVAGASGEGQNNVDVSLPITAALEPLRWKLIWPVRCGTLMRFRGSESHSYTHLSMANAPPVCAQAIHWAQWKKISPVRSKWGKISTRSANFTPCCREVILLILIYA
jgi:hypothetical protein